MNEEDEKIESAPSVDDEYDEFESGIEIERIPTYIDGFDERLGGGIPKGHVVLITGTAGTMKSSIAYNIMYHNAIEKGMKGAYISLEQDRESLLSHMRGLYLNPDKVKDDILILDLSDTRLDTEDFGLRKSWTFIIKELITKTREKMPIDILTLDSLNVYETMCGTADPRIELFEFLKWIKGLDLTCFLLSEMSMDSREYSKHGADFLADGILHLTMEMVDDVHSHRRVKCVKMRGTNHSTDYFALIFGSQRFRIPIGITDVWK